MNYLSGLVTWFVGLFRGVGSTQPAAVPEVPAVESVGEPEDRPEQLTPHFHLDEFMCADGTPVPDNLYLAVRELAENLEVLRARVDRPVTIISGFRTGAYNKRIGGAAKSQHLAAAAADVKVKGYSPKRLAALIAELIEEGVMKKGGVAEYPAFTHYDIRGKNVRWSGTRRAS